MTEDGAGVSTRLEGRGTKVLKRRAGDFIVPPLLQLIAALPNFPCTKRSVT